MKRALPIIIAKLAIVVLAALSACTMEPHYERPAAPVPAAWTGRLEVGNAESVTDIGWRQFFPDQNVQRLIELSLANNRDLRIAALNVQAAQAQYRIQRADLFPTVAVSGTEQVQKLPAGAVAPSAQGASTPTNGGTGSVPSNGHITRFYDVRNRLESRGHSRVRDACDSCGNVGRYVAIERPGDLVGLQPCAFAPGIVAEKPVTLTC